MEIFMKVPQHTIKPAVLKTVASQELEKEVEEQIASAKEDSSTTSPIEEIIEANEIVEDDEDLLEEFSG